MRSETPVSSALRSGLILSFEGIDASSKNTQSTLLFDYLVRSNIQAEILSFPDYSTYIGQEIKAFLSGSRNYNTETKHVLYAANRYELKERIQTWREQGKVIIANRYCESNLAYGMANGLPLPWLKELEKQMPQADFIFLLKATPKLSQLRKAQRDTYESDLDFLNRVAEVYDTLIEPSRWLVIEADRPKGEIHYEISRLALSLIKEVLNERETRGQVAGRIIQK